VRADVQLKLKDRSPSGIYLVSDSVISRLAKPGRAGYQEAMKTIAPLIILLGAFGTAALAQDTKSGADTNAPIKITAAQAKEHIGALAIVTGKIAEVNGTPRLMRLNFDHPFPKQTLTAVIFSGYTNLFPNLQGLTNKMVEVTGKIIEYRSRPEIQLQKTNQLRVLEMPAEPEKE
jgi:ribosomal protein L35AE/L33A